ncbi:MAG: AraC family transcriptional regulator [Polyangiaceae bacterium]|nr:AraC family transcriptional regulator [Polyangiaceae bacterium]
MVTAPTILASTTNALLRLAEAEGLERRKVLALAGVDPALLANDRARIARSADIAVWTAIERELGADDFGLRFVQSLSADAFGAVGLFAMSSPTVGEALERAARFTHVIKNDCEVHTRVEAKSEAFVLDERRLPGERPWSRPVADYALGTYVAFARRWSGRPVRPLEVRFEHAAPARSDRYEEFFGCPVLFGSAHPGLTFDKETLELPLQTAQSELEAFLSRMVEDEANALSSRDFAGDVRDAIRVQLRAGRLSLVAVARSIGTSGRTLQRHLGARNLTFHAVVEDVRRSLALELLTGTDLLVDTIGEQLGYSESGAFRRACRRWTGLPPATLRRQART